MNNGTIDAMIDSVTKTPELTDTEKKYLNYIVEYQNGESITTKQLVSKGSFVRLRVKVEFRKDITASDLPSQAETLNLSFKVNYVQSDDSNENITIDNNGKLIKIVSGNGTQVGDEVCIGIECFYIISSDDDSVTMLAKYNLYVGNGRTLGTSSCTPYGNEATGLQDSTMLGWVSNTLVSNGTTAFSSTNYWSGIVSSYPAYIYDSNTTLYNYVENYKTNLEKQGVEINEARLIKKEELEALGCAESSCKNAPSWIYSTSYWSGTSNGDNYIILVDTDGSFYGNTYSYVCICGVRPVIKIPISSLSN